MQRRELSVRTLFPLPCKNVGISHICASLCRSMSSGMVDVKLFTPRVAMGTKTDDFVEATLPHIASLVPYRLIRNRACAATEERFLRAVERGDIAYLWSDCTLDLFRRLKEAGVLLVREKYNCHTARSRQILDDAYARLGLPPAHGISDAAIEKEREQLELADVISCPSPMVFQSMIDEGISESKLVNGSYGWSPERFAESLAGRRKRGGLTVRWWDRFACGKGRTSSSTHGCAARLRGRLLLVGAVEPALADKYASLLSRPDITVTGFVSDPGRYFREADILAFPSLEEGDPLVTYEAAAHGLAMVVSPMGAGRGVRDGREGRVLPPYDTEAWEDALVRFDADADLRRHFGDAARARVDQFTWRHVGQRLANTFIERIEMSSTPELAGAL